jgi:MarR family transcriptional regulator, lower aerobic nicotinate degradation pathway regulator
MIQAMTAEIEPARLRRLPSRLLNQLATHADRLVGAGLSEVGAHKWHYTVLASLADVGPGSQATLSRRTGIFRSDMVAVINDLAEGGFVERTPDLADRRRNVVTITALGRARLAELGVLLADLQDALLAPLTSAERDQLIELLIRLADYHRRPLAHQLGHPVADGPVDRAVLGERDHHVLAADPGAGLEVGHDPPVQVFLALVRPAGDQRDPDEDDVAPVDAQVVGIEDQLARAVPRNDLEPVAGRDPDHGDECIMHTISDRPHRVR